MTRFLLTLLGSIIVCLASGQTICLDPGHPSENGVGTHGKHISELDAAWAVSVKLAALLRNAGYEVVSTKAERRESVTNKRRAEIGNEGQVDLMLRLHCDAGTKPGLATYYPGRKGKVGIVEGPSSAVIQASHRLAKIFHPAVIHALGGALADRGLHTEADTMIGAKQGALTGSIYAKVPVILVEMAVLQNEHDDAFIASGAGQDRIAAALFAGIRAAVARRS